MTLEEYEQYFLKIKTQQEKRKRMIKFIAGLLIGQVMGVMALALVSINRGEDEGR